MNPILLHRTYFGDNEATFRKAWEMGFSGVEVNAPGYNESLADVAAHADRLAAWKAKWLVGTMVLHYPMSLIDDAGWADRDAHFERMAESFHLAASVLGVRVVNTVAGGAIVAKGCAYTDYGKNGSATATDTHWERGVEMLRTACALAAEHGLTVTIETHGCLIHDRPQSTLKLLDMVGAANLKVNMDIPNMVLTLEDLLPQADIEALLPHVGHVHVKNLRFILGGGFLLEGASVGAVDYRPVVARLSELGYTGAYSLEFPGGRGDTELTAAQDLAFVKRLLIENIA
ncbi:MAG: sugar phosphate isomerase/epimerase [Kiritimatiellae bacterium]|nr:sugar phosphate isomerase/epimerase [Kiritimatiellia bacterium]